MAEPTSAVAAIVAAFSAVLLALFGLDYYALVWSFVGTLGAMFFRETSLGSGKSLVYIFLSTLLGAALAQGLVYLIGLKDQRQVIMLLSVIAGGGSQAVASALLEALINRIKRFGESK